MLHMKYRTRIYYTESDKALMWERWRQAESLQAIAQLFDRNHSAIGGIPAKTGGIRPCHAGVRSPGSTGNASVDLICSAPNPVNG
jgi:hypothetical protein